MWADILIAVSVLVFLAPVYLVARKLWTVFTRSLDEPEPETYGAAAFLGGEE